MTLKEDLVRDHVGLSDNRRARRYFAKFETILGHLPRVADEMRGRGRLDALEVEAVEHHLRRLARTFRALSFKYLMTGRDTGTFLGSLTVDRSASGFPVLRELLSMASDAAEAEAHLARLPSEDALKDAMVARIVGERVIPTDLQYALSQRLYHAALRDGPFLPRSDLGLMPVPEDGHGYLLHWAAYDGRRNLPVIWTMRVRDTAKHPLEADPVRLERVGAHLLAQALPELKLLTVATGFDDDFPEIEPVSFKRLTVGPMYSAAFTAQTEGLGRVLARAKAPPGEDWALAWTLEELAAARTETERAGWFGTRTRTIFAHPRQGDAAAGLTRMERAAILPERVFQTYAEEDAPGFRDVTKYVAGAGRVWRVG